MFNMYEPKRAPLAPKSVFYKRMARNLLLTMAVLGVCLVIGTLGYYWTRKTNDPNVPSALDCFHNASMILSGMGPVIEIKSNAGKWFSSFYALFSGVVFITNIGLLLAPTLHRLFHILHLETSDH
jgi:hypothetical protein